MKTIIKQGRFSRSKLAKGIDQNTQSVKFSENVAKYFRILELNYINVHGTILCFVLFKYSSETKTNEIIKSFFFKGK